MIDCCCFGGEQVTDGEAEMTVVVFTVEETIWADLVDASNETLPDPNVGCCVARDFWTLGAAAIFKEKPPADDWMWLLNNEVLLVGALFGDATIVELTLAATADDVADKLWPTE